MRAFSKKISALCLGTALALGAASAANAADTMTDTLNVTLFDFNRDTTPYGTVYNSSLTNGSEVVYAARFAVKGTDVSTGLTLDTSWESFCVDLKDNLTAGTFSYTYNGGINALSTLNLSAAASSALIAIVQHADSYIGLSADRSAGVQLAIWEVLYDWGNLNLTTGNFSEAGYSSAVTSYASDVLNNITSATWQMNDSSAANVTVGVATGTNPSNNQTQLVYHSNAIAAVGLVPEPATWGMMVIGFGALGATLRRRRAATHAII